MVRKCLLDGNKVVLRREADIKLLCNMGSVVMRAPEDQAKEAEHAAISSSVQQLTIQEELIQAVAHGPKTRTRLWKGNPSEAGRDEHKATQLTLVGASVIHVATCQKFSWTTSSRTTEIPTA